MAKEDVLKRGLKASSQFIKITNYPLCTFNSGLASVLCDNVDKDILNMHQVNIIGLQIFMTI